MTSAGEYRRKISKSVRFCSRVVRRTIEGRIFPPIRENSGQKEVGGQRFDNLSILSFRKMQIVIP